MQLKKASRQQTKLRIGLSGPSGSGKTYSALLLAHGICSDRSKIAVIDTENMSADLYSHLGEYNTLTLGAPFSPERYIEAIKTCENAGMEVIIIDSITHEWDGPGGIIEISNNMQGNSFTNWGKLTPRHNSFINAILQSSCHILTTVRRKQEYALGKDEKTGKSIVEKLGLKEITREGFEYELTINFDIDREKHLATASKDRTGLFEGRDYFLLTSEIGEEIKNWNLSGEKALTLEEKNNINFQKYYDLFMGVTSIDEIEKLSQEIKEEIGKNSSFISKKQLGEIGSLINDLKLSIENKKEEPKKEKTKKISDNV